MFSVISAIFAPFVFLIEKGFSLYLSVTGSPGLSILLTSATFSIAVLPLQRRFKRFEDRIGDRHEKVRGEVSALDRELRGELRFNEIEKIYSRHNYHPIHSIVLGLSFLVSIPFLIASVLLFNESNIVAGAGFLFIDDLSLPDGTLRLDYITVNVLPFILFVFTFFDAWLRYRESLSTRHRFMIISIILTVLVYAMPAGLLLYWIGANAMSFIIYQASNRRWIRRWCD